MKNEAGKKKRVLFLCTHNSARSQMAEGLLRGLYPDRYESYSAGTEGTRVNPFAIKAMAEVGIDISGQRSKSVEEFRDQEFDYVVTVCDNARETCPFFPSVANNIHRGFDDPAAIEGTDEAILAGFRRVRDEIREWIDETFGGKGETSGAV